jgi:hypothetical protein
VTVTDNPEVALMVATAGLPFVQVKGASATSVDEAMSVRLCATSSVAATGVTLTTPGGGHPVMLTATRASTINSLIPRKFMFTVLLRSILKLGS